MRGSKKSSRRAATVAAALALGSIVGVAAPSTASADLYNCSASSYNGGVQTRSRCTSTTGFGSQRARHVCTDGSHGWYQYGAWVAVNVYSYTPACYATVTNRGYQIS